MTVTGSQLLLFYLCLFLGIVFILWMFGGWKTSRAEQKAVERVECPVCGFHTPREHSCVSLRCLKCGARRPLQTERAERS
jgi:hypothetical protein